MDERGNSFRDLEIIIKTVRDFIKWFIYYALYVLIFFERKAVKYEYYYTLLQCIPSIPKEYRNAIKLFPESLV